ncbi:MAG: radical SAM protein [Myxococcota bacterium]|nr:radical SAM protein [Myxococcota bacterium]
MKVLFIEIEMERNWSVASIGPAFLSSYVRNHGYETSILHIPFDEPILDIVSAILDENPDILGISLTTRQWQRARKILNALRDRRVIPTIVGGLHPTFSPESTLRQKGIDYICLGEGEGAFLDFLHQFRDHGRIREPIPNIWARGEKRPTVRPPVPKLDDLPFMDRALLNEKYGVVNMTTQRGCPFPCTYCAARMYNEMYGNAQYGRRRSIENVLDELHYIRENFLLSYVIYLDDTFTINHKWIREFLRAYQEQLAIPFSIHARAETINQRMLAQLAQAGCKHITFGVESGSERLRYDVMHRKVTNKRLVEAFRWSRSLGIITTANYIIGTPTETRDDIEQTIALHHELQPDDFGYFVFYPYPGTPMFKYCLDRGLLPADFEDREANHRETILLHDQLHPDEIEEYYGRFTQLREEAYLQKYGNRLSEASKSEVKSRYQDIASSG